ncbi:Ubiquitin carboxyl-terminal hydrolase 24 [Chelonia mydas]|uniref:Ubiquitin carboxyl-terminal hydrolase 24 n=1 Tax=Chelonia mydas TaxID=8469 RepID=M7BDE0_CHEMY|nr:Ubiquitin carboxyl-terminal hydrolase 24 [Chelonia mydas]
MGLGLLSLRLARGDCVLVALGLWDLFSLELMKNDENGNCSGEGIEFPTTNLYELESRVLTDHWSIPYKREESLGKCLIASTYLARLGLSDSDENCKRFMDRCMPEAFKKAFNPDNEYHFKNRMKFAELGGFSAIQSKLHSEDIELGPMLDPVIHKMIKYVQNVEEKDLKDKRLVSIPELLSAIKLLCMRFQPDLVTVVDDLRLDILLRMLKSPHFSAKMNSLKEVTKLIEDSTVSKSVKNAIDTDRLLNWLVENSVLSIALEGNIDQAQYCDRIKGIIELLGSKLSLDELTKIWRIQSGQSSTVIENIHTIIAAAAVKFSSDQLNHLFVLIQKVLEVLWELAHLPTLPCGLIQQALEEHLTILSDAYAVKEAIKRSYIIKCIEDIKRVRFSSSQHHNPQFVWVVPALRQLHEITRSFIKQTYQKQDKSIIQDLKKNFEIVKLVTGSLIACHRLAASVAGPGGLVGATLVDGRYTYREYLEAHLKFLAFFLQEATLYLGWNRAREIWECLVTGQDVCELDREMCFEWFTKGQHDLESDIQQQLFKEKILKLESYEITMNGFSLFKTFFENVNLCDHRLKRQGTQLNVEKLELIGMDFIWKIAMESPDEEIANEAIQLIINYSYINLNPRLKKDSVSLHKKFIADCYTRLEAASSALGGPTLTHAVTRATKMLTATAMPTVATSVQSPYRSTKLVIIERLLLLAERYVITIEDLYSVPRTILPHGASFHGHLLTLNVTYESTKDTFTIEAHSNETVGSVRWKIAKLLNSPVDNIQIFANESLLTVNKDQKLLHQLGFSEEHVLTVKTSGSGTPSGSSVDSSTSSSNSSGVFSSSYVMEQEKSLPGVVMALVCNVFDMLYQLANLEEPRITLRVRKLLLLIPTDPAIQEALDQLDSLGRKKTLLSESSSQSSKSPSLSSKHQHQPSASSILESLFRSFAPGMSTFRVLYNLEVLSSKLMPTADDEMARNCAKSFCENFLRAGGLSLVVNVMQRDSIPSEVDYETRQGVYSICLQLARFLLVGQTLPTLLDEDILKDGVEALSSRPFRNVSRQASRQMSICGTPEKSSYRQLSVSDRSSIRVEEIIPAARVAIQTMEINDFTSTVACFMRLSWAAAAGRLDLVGSSQPIKESNTLFPLGIRNRLSSSGSFYGLPCVADFIIDILLGSPSAECTEYFDLRCQLLDDLTSSEMEQLKISPAVMLEDEITWLDNFEPNRTAECETSEADNILLAGHLRLIKTLLSLCGAEKEMLGSSLIKPLLDDFLFRASRIILNSNSPAGSAAISQQDFHPKCSTVDSRLAAYEVLVMLADSSPSNLQLITKELLSMHHQPDPTLTKEFDYLPPVDSRSTSGFVGLKNGGATCYMNAVFQQLYMQPGLPEALLSIDDDMDNPDDSVFYQIQSLFGHLMESKLQYYVPENFWKIFKMWNKELYVREQQDAYEFFTSLIDQMDEYLKGKALNGTPAEVTPTAQYPRPLARTTAVSRITDPQQVLGTELQDPHISHRTPGTGPQRHAAGPQNASSGHRKGAAPQFTVARASWMIPALRIPVTGACAPFLKHCSPDYYQAYEQCRWIRIMAQRGPNTAPQLAGTRLPDIVGKPTLWWRCCAHQRKTIPPRALRERSRWPPGTNCHLHSEQVLPRAKLQACGHRVSGLDPGSDVMSVRGAQETLPPVAVVPQKGDVEPTPHPGLAASSSLPDEAGGGPSQTVPQDDGKAHQKLLKWVAANRGLEVEKISESVDSLFDVLAAAALAKMALPVHDGVVKIKIGRDQLFKNTFQGIYSDQKICKDCPHRYEREEAFMALNLGVTSCQSLEISLDQFVRGEVLEGSNAYYCEKCKEKRTTVKRTCIKALPSVLVIHLMRFGFDWESGRSIKYDEQIRFPWMLNMEPYTVSGMARQDSSSEVGDNGRNTDQGGGGSPRKKVAPTENYELVGVIVHSGQAHAGHYYSFIKDRRGCGKGKWYKFNDTVVEEFELTDETLEYECFGGEYRPKVYDQSNPYPDVRRRYWNAYMLFYQRVSDQNSPVLPKKSRVSVVRQEAEDLSLSAPSSPEISPQSSPRPHRPNSDRLSILTKLVRKGEKKGLFVEKMPVRIYQMVRDENLKFMKNRDVYSTDYFSFVLSLASLNATKLKHPYYPCMAKVSLQLAVQFLFQTYLRTKKKLRIDTEEWIATIDALLSKSFDACQWLVEYLVGSEGRELVKTFLLECSVREVRIAVATILEKTLDGALLYQDKLKSLHQVMEVLLALLDKDVPENCKNCAQYFFLFNNFVHKQGIRASNLLLRHSALRHMINFLLGPNRQNNQNRRWSSAQAREFGFLHNTVALLVLHSDVSSQRNVAPGLFKQRPPLSITASGPLLSLHEEVEALLFLSEGKPYLLEVMHAFRELTGSLSVLIEMVVYCCFCNEHFSLTVLHFIKNQLETAPPHELKNIFQLLHEILVIEDPLQVERVKFAFETENGLLGK